MTRDRCEIYQQFKAIDGAYRAGDVVALRKALGDLPDFPNCLQPAELAVGDYPLADVGREPRYVPTTGRPTSS